MALESLAFTSKPPVWWRLSPTRSEYAARRIQTPRWIPAFVGNQEHRERCIRTFSNPRERGKHRLVSRLTENIPACARKEITANDVTSLALTHASAEIISLSCDSLDVQETSPLSRGEGTTANGAACIAVPPRTGNKLESAFRLARRTGNIPSIEGNFQITPVAGEPKAELPLLHWS